VKGFGIWDWYRRFRMLRLPAWLAGSPRLGLHYGWADCDFLSTFSSPLGQETEKGEDDRVPQTRRWSIFGLGMAGVLQPRYLLGLVRRLLSTVVLVAWCFACFNTALLPGVLVKNTNTQTHEGDLIMSIERRA
jgi:hypothetical protein